MLLNRDFVAYMAREIVKNLLEKQMIESPAGDALTQRVRQAIADELGVEERLNEEVRGILEQHSDAIRREGASYQEMYKKVKSQLARERKLILR